MTREEAIEKMEADIRFRGLAPSTLKRYTRMLNVFWAFCNRPIEELNETDVRHFLEHLIVNKRLDPRTVNLYNAAVRFFFAVSLNRTMNYLQMPLMKVSKKLPPLLTKEEVSALLDACQNLKHKAILLLAYGSGLRAGEIVCLRVADIDSGRMRVFVKGGKNKRDHFSILSHSTLGALREYWKLYRPKSPDGWLFPGSKNIGHLSEKAVAYAFSCAVNNTGIVKEVSAHSLRHAFATHLLEDGADPYKIKELLGHLRIQSTFVYLHLAGIATIGVTSPADLAVPLKQ